MPKSSIPTTSAIQSKLQFDTESISLSENGGAMQKAIYNYYKEFSNTFGPARYTLSMRDEYDENEFSVRTLYGLPRNQTEFQLRKIVNSEYTVSEYDPDYLKKIGFDTSIYWNGDILWAEYSGDGTFDIHNSDYYTVKTFENALQFEAIHTVQSSERTVDKTDFALRTAYLNEKSDFYSPARPAPVVANGAVILNTGETLKLLIAERSDEVSVDKGMYSLVPGGHVEKKDMLANLFENAVKREFTEELFSGRQSDGERLLQDGFSVVPACTGYVLRSGQLIRGFMLLLKDDRQYHEFRSLVSTNSETNRLIEVDINSLNQLQTVLSLDKMSGDAISTICAVLQKLNSTPKYPDLPYTIERQVV